MRAVVGIGFPFHVIPSPPKISKNLSKAKITTGAYSFAMLLFAALDSCMHDILDYKAEQMRGVVFGERITHMLLLCEQSP
jgi:hypothetical protein